MITKSLFLFFSLKLENLGNFIKAILAYGLKPNDIFEANDLFENGNMTQVQTTLLALASMVSFVQNILDGDDERRFYSLWQQFGFGVAGTMPLSFFHLKAKTKGMDTKVDIGVKYADKQTRNFDDEKMKAGQCVIGLQVWLQLVHICCGFGKLFKMYYNKDDIPYFLNG